LKELYASKDAAAARHRSIHPYKKTPSTITPLFAFVSKEYDYR
jgi:hypothetical protein